MKVSSDRQRRLHEVPRLRQEAERPLLHGGGQEIHKGKADAEAVVFKALTDPKGDHPEVKAKPEDIKTAVKWILTP